MNSNAASKLVKAALDEGRTALSEYESKRVLAHYGFAVTREVPVTAENALAPALDEIGFPLVMKACSPDIAHKTEKNLVRVGIRDRTEAQSAYREIKQAIDGSGGFVLVQEMVSGRRELVLGMVRDPQFGPCVMFGLGGVFTEILKDIAFRKAPLDEHDAYEMMGEIKGHRILEAVRGMAAAEKDVLARWLIGLGQLALDIEAVAEIDINPVILSGSRPVAVDALIILKQADA